MAPAAREVTVGVYPAGPQGARVSTARAGPDRPHARRQVVTGVDPAVGPKGTRETVATLGLRVVAALSQDMDKYKEAFVAAGALECESLTCVAIFRHMAI